ncbi:MMPL family transporter [Ectobacillus funiculus]|uniref:MMPL family transporter n=1 Tax=Ectobacillus funiculus TaxID=137993 RepID=A0ABV5WAF8_9BACI
MARKIKAALGQFSLSKPFRALLFVAIIVVPLLVSYNDKLSFNSLSEIGESYESVKGFNTIADSFGPGEVMPVQVVIESEKNLDSAEGFAAMASRLESLTDGLGQSVEGLQEVSKGLGSAQDYLGKLTNNTDPEMSGFYVPSEALESSDFQQVFDRYLSTDKKVAKFEVVLKHNPYSDQALRASREVKTTVERAIARTELKGANYGVSGMSASSSDMLAASDKDYSQTVIYMIIGVSIILIILLRSIIMPLYLVVSLLLCFYSSLAINEVIFVDILGYDGINWTMPFFGFVLLMALGVDYSIFLMDRFNEYKEMPVGEAILTAMRNMGTVIFSAVIILGGTFAAMYPAGVLSLAQIATIVLAGLVLYAFVFLPFFVPVMVKVFGRANWFPFDRNQEMRKNNNQDISG